MRLSVVHTTHYSSAQPLPRGLQRLRLKPKTTHGQHVLNWQMHLEGAMPEAEFDDHNHNRTMLASVEPGTHDVKIVCSGLIETSDQVGIIGHHAGFFPLWAFLAQTPLTRPGPGMRALIAGLEADGSNPLTLLHALSCAMLEAGRYETGHTNADTPAEEAMAMGCGVCQDHAHIFIGAARSFGVPARYVSGYLMMDDMIDQQAGHGWVEAHVDGLGWVGFDVSNGISPDARYVRVATGCDYREAAPVTGISFGRGETALTVSLAVEQQFNEQ